MTNLRILVTGSRDFNDSAKMRIVLFRVLEALGHEEDSKPVLVHGDARGADTIARRIWTLEWGFLDEAHSADWELYGKAAGHIRNAEMAELGADVCIAFPTGKSPGTRGMMNLCRKKGIRVIDASSIPDDLLYDTKEEQHE